MKTRVSVLMPRVVMYAAMLGLIVYAAHFALPVDPEGGTAEVVFKPALQIGLFLTLTVCGALIGFWITFGDLINPTEN